MIFDRISHDFWPMNLLWFLTHDFLMIFYPCLSWFLTHDSHDFCYLQAARSAYDSVLVLQPSSESSAEFKDFVQRVKIRTLDMYNYTMRDDEVDIISYTLGWFVKCSDK